MRISRYLLLLAALSVLLVGISGASTSYIKTTFQDYPSVTVVDGSLIIDDWTLTSTGATYYSKITNPDTNGVKYVDNYYSGSGSGSCYLTSANYGPFSYLAFTAKSAGYIDVIFYTTGGSLIYSSILSPTVSGARYEYFFSGGTITIKRNGVTIATPAYTVYPDYVIIRTAYGGGHGMFDDVVIGFSDDSTIVGSIPSNYFIYYDVATNLTGLYSLPTTVGGSPTLINSNTFGLSYGRSTSSATTLNLIDPSGNIVRTYAVTNMSATPVISLTDLMVSGRIAYGTWSVKLADDPTTQYFYVMNGGAALAFDKDDYSPKDVATVSYFISETSWLSGHTYNMKFQDVYGNIKATNALLTQSGTSSYTFTDSDDPGVYYAIITRTSSTGDVVTLGFDYANLQSTFGFTGYVNDAETGTVISGANVTMVQSTISDIAITIADGNYSTSGFGTGQPLSINATAPGYHQYYITLTPLSAHNTVMNITINRTTPVAIGNAILGVAREGIFTAPFNVTGGYGKPIEGATVLISNTTTGESYTRTTNIAGGYVCGETETCLLTLDRPYNISATKAGFNNSPFYRVVIPQ